MASPRLTDRQRVYLRLMREQGRTLRQGDGWSLRVVRCLADKGLARVTTGWDGTWEAVALPSNRADQPSVIPAKNEATR